MWFAVFQHGDRKSFDQHYHVLMAIEGEPTNWSDFRIEMTVRGIDHEFIKGHRWEKPVHVDWNWYKGNRYHAYGSRFAVSWFDGEWFIL